MNFADNSHHTLLASIIGRGIHSYLQGRTTMRASPKRSWPYALAAAILILNWFVLFARAQEPSPPKEPGQPQTAEQPGAPAKPQESSGQGKAAGGGSGQGQRFDQAVVSAGQAAFERSCTKCH